MTTVDYHTHSTYSDGSLLVRMLDAALDAGLDGVGIVDHCIVSDQAAPRDRRDRRGFNLDLTYERRRDAIQSFRSEVPIAVYDGVEIDYDPADEPQIASFLADAAFDYAVGSIHLIDGVDVQDDESLAALSARDRAALVETYFDRLVSLIESELFAVAAHPDLIERADPLRDIAGQSEYERVAEAFADSRTLPEINAGRVHRGFGRVHPTAEFLAVLEDYDLDFTIGTDAHRPDELIDRYDYLESFLENTGITPVPPPPLQ